MFNALLISLLDGQSYKHVRMLEDADIASSGYPRLFEDYTAIFHTADSRVIICHHWNIKVIQLDKEQRGKTTGISVERIVMVGDTFYSPAVILPQALWEDRGIPYYFVKHTGISGQFVFSAADGTFLAEDMNVVSVIYPQAPKRPILAAAQDLRINTPIRKMSLPQGVKPAKIWHRN